jgi:hypothetical protein
MEQNLSNALRYGQATLAEAPISWSAIAAGAVVGLAISIVMTLLAAGFGVSLAYGGLASHNSLLAFTPIFGATAIAVQVVSAGIGGYVTGRLRHTWLMAHTDEAHFRDTAHGLIAWALATVAGLILAAAVITPYAEQLATVAAMAPPATPTAVEMARAANIITQSSFFAGIGMLLSAFTASVAARLGGLRSEEMHLKVRA